MLQYFSISATHSYDPLGSKNDWLYVDVLNQHKARQRHYTVEPCAMFQLLPYIPSAPLSTCISDCFACNAHIHQKPFSSTIHWEKKQYTESIILQKLEHSDMTMLNLMTWVHIKNICNTPNVLDRIWKHLWVFLFTHLFEGQGTLQYLSTLQWTNFRLCNLHLHHFYHSKLVFLSQEYN